MSYILDALKKSEQERGHGNVPDVQTVHSSSLNYRNEKKAYWPYVLIVAVILNLVAIAYFIFDKNNRVETTAAMGNIPAEAVVQQQSIAPVPQAITQAPSKPVPVDTGSTANQNSQATAQETAPQIPPEVISKTPLETEATTKQTMPEEMPATSKTVAVAPEPLTRQTDSNDDIIDYYELPESIKQQLPAITISAHVYSSNPLQRSIVINNNFMEEGEYVLDDLVLYEITRDGAVFNYRGTLFNYGVVSGWQ